MPRFYHFLEARAEIRKNHSLFERIENTTISFWDFLTFTIVWKLGKYLVESHVHKNKNSTSETISFHCAIPRCVGLFCCEKTFFHELLVEVCIDIEKSRKGSDEKWEIQEMRKKREVFTVYTPLTALSFSNSTKFSWRK